MEFKISVIMGIYNCEETLGEAIESIIAQTEQSWELIMCDDGSVDHTYEVAKHYYKKFPERIVIIKNTHNMGLNATLNRCLQLARGKYIARMDGDDICASDRFEKELNALENEPEIAIVGTNMAYFDESGCWGEINMPIYPQKKDFLKRTPFCHATCMVRKEAYDKVNGYSEDKKLLRVEDYHLWMKMYQAGYRGKNIQETLYSMRDDRNAYKRRKLKYRFNEAYIKILVVQKLHLPFWGGIFALKPIIVGLMPPVLYDRLHKRSLRVDEK